MKTIDVKSMLIGFLLCACFFLTIGATKKGSAGTFARYSEQTILDTRNGDLYTKYKGVWKKSHPIDY